MRVFHLLSRGAFASLITVGIAIAGISTASAEEFRYSELKGFMLSLAGDLQSAARSQIAAVTEVADEANGDRMLRLCRARSDLLSEGSGPWDDRFLAINIANDVLLMEGTDDDLVPLEPALPFLRLLSASHIHTLIALQNERQRLPGYCDFTGGSLGLDFDYMVLAVRSGDAEDLLQTLGSIDRLAGELADSIKQTPDSDAVLEVDSAPDLVRSGWDASAFLGAEVGSYRL